MANNKGKKFEQVIKEAFEKIPDVSVDRVHDQTTRYKGSTNICDFIVYKKPHEYYIECKTVHGNTLPFSNITQAQWEGLLEKSKIKGVTAGIMCWWVDKDTTKFMPIGLLYIMKEVWGMKSVRYDYEPFYKSSTVLPTFDLIPIQGKKKQVYYDYNMTEFFELFERG